MAQSNVVFDEQRDEIRSLVSKKYRVQLDFAAVDFDEVNELVTELGLPTRAELFRDALITLRWMYNKKRQGYSVMAISPDEERLIEPEFPFFEKIGRINNTKEERQKSR
jgi:metal-responsive CopG/Arc/MetJ family transcriptional regulator